MKTPLLLLILFAVNVLQGCSSGYETDGDSVVYYKHWNESDGQMKDTLDADPKTFKALDFDKYAKDAKSVFYDGSKIPGADAASFEAIGPYYAKDRNHGYYANAPIKESSGTGFKAIDEYYSTDGHDVFYKTEALHVANPAGFKYVYDDDSEKDWERWATDGQYYYILGYKIPSTDYQHVTLYKNSGGIAKDRFYAYYLNRRLNFDIQGKRIVDTIDAASFTATGFMTCKDKNGCINVFQGRINCPN